MGPRPQHAAASSCSSRTSRAAASPSGTAARPTRCSRTSTSSSTSAGDTVLDPGRRPHLQDGLPAVHRGPPPPAGRRDDRRPPRAARRGHAGWASSRSTTTTASSSGRRSPSSPRATSRRWASTSSRSGRSARWLGEDRDDFGRDVIPAMLDGGARVFGYRFEGYWQDVGTIQSYWEANMALLEDHPELDLYDKDWLIHTRSEERAPAKIGPTAQVHRSLISARLRDQRDGREQRAVAGRPRRRRRGRARLDRHVRHASSDRARSSTARSSTRRSSSARAAIVGDGPDFDTPNRQEPARLNTGITRRRQAGDHPARGADRPQREGRRRVKATDFVSKVVRNGASVEAGGAKPRRAKKAAPAAAAERRRLARTRAHQGRTAPGRASGSRSPAAPAGCRRSRGARLSQRACPPARIAMQLPRRPGRIAARP